MEGERNTKVFYAYALAKWRKWHTGMLRDTDEVWCAEPVVLKEMVRDFYIMLYSADTSGAVNPSS